MTSLEIGHCTFSRRPAHSTGQTKLGTGPDDIVIGKDVLELLSTSMYVDPMTIYREYVQNAADAIDEARAQDCLRPTRRARSRSRSMPRRAASASAITAPEFLGPASHGSSPPLVRAGSAGPRRGAFGALAAWPGSATARRSFSARGPQAKNLISELRWDCRRLQAALRSVDFNGGLTDVIHDVVAVRRVAEDGYPERFFEVELRGVIRHRHDQPLSPPCRDRVSRPGRPSSVRSGIPIRSRNRSRISIPMFILGISA